MVWEEINIKKIEIDELVLLVMTSFLVIFGIYGFALLLSVLFIYVKVGRYYILKETKEESWYGS